MRDSSPEELVVVGGGPAGYAASLYAARGGLKPLVIEGFQPGGQLQNTRDVENYPGAAGGDPVLGPELVRSFRSQAESFGARFLTDDASELKLTDGGMQSVWVGEREISARSVILAMGAEPRRLGVPGERELMGRGVSTCAVCDGAFFRGRDVAVIGGGDAAAEEVVHLAALASSVILIHRRGELRASKLLQERVSELGNVTLLTPYVVREFQAAAGGAGSQPALSSLRLEDALTGEESQLGLAGAFVAVGHTPRSELTAGQIELDDQGYVRVADPTTQTSLKGVFSVGDLSDPRYRQAVTAAGSGVRGALDAERYLRGV